VRESSLSPVQAHRGKSFVLRENRIQLLFIATFRPAQVSADILDHLLFFIVICCS
jgi:hypothetical protein